MDEIAGLLTDAIHPKLTESPCVLSDIRKISSASLHGDQTSSSVTADDKLLIESICGPLPRIGSPTTKLEWAKYVSKLDKSDRRPNWELTATWTDQKSVSATVRAAARRRHIALLKEAFLQRKLLAMNLGESKGNVEYSPTSRITIHDFREYAARFNVPVVVRSGKGAVPWKPTRRISWIESAVDLAHQIYARDSSLNGLAIAAEVHAHFRKEKVTGRGDKVPTPGTILRKAIKGIVSRRKVRVRSVSAAIQNKVTSKRTVS